jgi:hypothetical protein
MTNTLSSLALLLATLSPGAGGDALVPGRDGNYDFETSSLIGTVWEGKIVVDDTSIVRFDPKGVLRIRYFNQTTLQANWRQQGDKIVVCEGLLQNDLVVGSAKNKAGLKWTWELKRKPASAGNIFGGAP